MELLHCKIQQKFLIATPLLFGFCHLIIIKYRDSAYSPLFTKFKVHITCQGVPYCLSDVITTKPHAKLSFKCSDLWNTVMCHLTMGICSEKCAVRQFRCRVNIIECTYTNLDSIAYYIHRLYCIAYCS